MTRKLVGFSTILLGIWAAICLPAIMLAGAAGVKASAAAAAICGVPALATLALQPARRTPQGRALVLVAGMLVRMGISLGAGLTVYYNMDERTLDHFLVWLVFFYFVSLFTEVGFVVHSLGRDPSNNGGGARPV